MRFSETITPSTGELVVVDDAREMDAASRLRDRLPKDLAMVNYAIHDRRLLQGPVVGPISTHARVHANGIYVTRITDRFQTEMEIGGAGLARFWFALANAGSIQVDQGQTRALAEGAAGFAVRGLPGTRLLGSDGSVRTNVWIDATGLERTLAAMIGDGLRKPLEFHTAVDWGSGLAISLRRQLSYFASELRRADGLAASPVALTALTDLILQTLLQALPHTYSDRLASRAGDATPGILSRAEGFMRAHADQPLRMADVAEAAGCGIRTLNAVYARFRGTTPSAALRGMRLEQARDALRQNGAAPIGDVAGRFGFSNAGRFAKAYSQRFGELPSQTGTKR
jgi:AraC-like DNA-binding protein